MGGTGDVMPILEQDAPAKPISYHINRIDGIMSQQDRAVLYCIENNQKNLELMPTVYAIPVSISRLQELGINVGSHVTLEIKPEGQ